MEPKNILESLLKENIEMINEITEITKGDYQTGYIQALLNVQSSLEHRLLAMEPFHAAATHLYMSFQKYIQNREHYVNIT
jgi:hypothetical protein